MRKVGDISGLEPSNRFVAYLKSQKIEAESREIENDVYGIWVYDEDFVLLGEEHLLRFSQTPELPEFALGSLKSFLLTKSSEPTTSKSLLKSRLNSRISTVVIESKTPVMWGILLVCFALTLFAKSPLFEGVMRQYLYFSHEAFEGQIWRFITPIFLHGNAIHLLFNMLWMYELGGDIERQEGSLFFTVLVFGIALICNISQYFVTGPNFVGMSGVVYALVGYVWMMSRYKVGSSYTMSDQTMLIMVIWLVICVIGIIPNVANTEHIAGIISGLGIGSLRSGYLQKLRRRIFP